MQLTKQQQQEFAARMNQELEKVTMSWNNDLKRWYGTAIKALDFASAMSLQIPQRKVIELYHTTQHGINMNVVAVLCNNLENRTAFEMNLTGKDWADFLVLNAAIGQYWNELMLPIQKKIAKEFEIMAGKPKFQIITGEA